MSQFLFDKGLMALKAQRYDEAQSAYEKALENEYSVAGWCGLGICKLFQIADNQTMEEVIYCFDKARQVEGSNHKEIDLQLLQYSLVSILQCGAYAIASIKNAIEAEKKAKKAAVIGLASLAVSAISDNANTKIIAGAAAAAAGGVAIGQFGKLTSSKEIGKYSVELLRNVYNNVYEFLIKNENIKEAEELKENTSRICEEINDLLTSTLSLEERAKIANKRMHEKSLEDFQNHTDEDVKKLYNFFNENGAYNLMRVTKGNIEGNKILAQENDKPLFYLVSHLTGGTHTFCNKGVLKNNGFGGDKYFKYSEIENLKKNWIGVFKDKSSGYSINLEAILNKNGQELVIDWGPAMMDFINSKK